MHRTRPWFSLVVLAVLALVAATPRAARAQQTPEQVRDRLAYLQQQERIVLEHRNWWVEKLGDPDLFLLPLDTRTPWTNQRSMPRIMQRAMVMQLANHLGAVYVAIRMPNPPTIDELIRDAEEQSATLKEVFRTTILPAFDRDLDGIRSEFNALMQQRTRPGQTPPIAPAGRAWYFRRPVIGADRTNADFTLLDSDATETGGYVQVRGRVPSTNCFETWQMKWTFGQNVSRLQEGMEVPVTLEAQLVSTPCPSPLASFIAMGGGGTERIIMNSAPSPVLQGAIAESSHRAAADGRTRYGTTTATLKVERNPAQSNAWTLFRLQVYMPGQFWVVGYVYLAGGG